MRDDGPPGGDGGRPTTLAVVPACPACGDPHRVTVVEVSAQMHPTDEVFSFVRCQACDLVYLAPRVPAHELGRYYTDAYLPYRGARAWGPFSSLVERGFRGTDRKRVRTVRRFAEVEAGTVVLDVGCGKPSFLEALVGATGCRGIGTDFSDSGWTEETARWANLELLEGDLHELTLPERPSVVTMWHYLEHDYRPRETLARLREMVDGDGRGATLVIEVPDHDSWTRRRHGATWAGYHAPRHASLFTAATLRSLLERTGWEVLHVEQAGTMDPYILHWMSRMEERDVDWTGDFGRRFPGFVLGKVLWGVRFGLRRRGLGILTAVARTRSPSPA